jgi:hypothetical protein
MIERCSRCRKVLRGHFYLCDEALQIFCPHCFKTTECGQDDHDDGCGRVCYPGADLPFSRMYRPTRQGTSRVSRRQSR